DAAALLGGRGHPAAHHAGAAVLARRRAGCDRIPAELVGRPPGRHRSPARRHAAAAGAGGWPERRRRGELMARAKNVPNDPQRRARIIAPTTRILQEEGVTGVRARAVAARAEVHLSSVSYHFPSVRELLLEASRRVAALRTEGLRSWSAQITAETIIRCLAEQIHAQITSGRAVTVIAYELYILGLRMRISAASRSRSATPCGRRWPPIWPPRSRRAWRRPRTACSSAACSPPCRRRSTSSRSPYALRARAAPEARCLWRG